jgi:cytochrome c biogenesis protein
VEDGHVYARSNEVVNPAVHLIVTSTKSEKAVNFWLPEIPGIAENSSSPYNFEPKDLKTGVFTGLEVSHEPGQWAVWAGVVLMAIGLTFVFYVVHVRYWVVPVQDARGNLALWIGGSANRNRDAFEQTFRKFVQQIEEELKPKFEEAAEKPAAELPKTTTVGR